MAKGKLVPMDLRGAYEEIKKRHEAGEPHKVLTRDEIDEMRAMIEAAAGFKPVADRIFTTEQAADYVSRSAQTLRNWAESGKLVPDVVTDGGQRLYSEQELINFKKKEMGVQQIIIPDVKPGQIITAIKQFLSSFDPNQCVEVTIQTDEANRKVTFVVVSEDGLLSQAKTLKMED